MFKIAVVSVIGLFLVQLLKQYKPDYAIAVKIVAILLVVGLLLPDVTSIMNSAQGLINEADMGSGYITIILKSLGISVVAQIASDMCRDSNELSLASVIELAGKTAILILAMPVLKGLLSVAMGMIEV